MKHLREQITGQLRTVFPKETGGQPLTAAQRKRRDNARRSWLRAGIQLMFLLLAPSLFTSAFAGIKQLFTAVGTGDPFAWSSFLAVLTGLCVFTMVFGRFFCGYACAFGALGDFIYYLSGRLQKALKKSGRQTRSLPGIPNGLRYLPYGILTVIVLLCALGVYGRLTGWSPWDVFSMVMAGRLPRRQYIAGSLLLVLILAGMAWEPRFFCRFLCPMGAVFRLLPILPWAVLRRDRERCLKSCSACEKTCPVKLRLSAGENAGDCIRCGKCQNACPVGNIKGGLPGRKGNELWLTGLKALLLLGLALAVGAVRFP